MWEGTLTMLLRHLPDTNLDSDSISSTHNTGEKCLSFHLRHVKFIWISHAHWDHYGGLPAVLQAIYDRRQEIKRRVPKLEQPSKRLRIDAGEPPVCVIAPIKVLKYLDIALNCHRGERNTPGDLPSAQLFRGCAHEQCQSWWPYLSSIHLPRLRHSAKRFPQRAPASELSTSPVHTTTNLSDTYVYHPFAFWENIRVDHSCFGSFGFVMGLRVPADNGEFAGGACGATLDFDQKNCSTITFAYSGDTRPCRRFIDRCQFYCHPGSHGNLRYLLHEASFDDDAQEMSFEKKHTSLSEALHVAADLRASNVLLTHFSQRYDSYPPMTLPPASPLGNRKKIAFLLDGMLVQLQ
jgi:ribonuclease BN (tRNA processing enzyme)